VSAIFCWSAATAAVIGLTLTRAPVACSVAAWYGSQMTQASTLRLSNAARPSAL